MNATLKKVIFKIRHQGHKLKCKEENKFHAGIGFASAFTNEHHCSNSETGLDFMFPEPEFRNWLSWYAVRWQVSFPVTETVQTAPT